jgi:hypothetical protein
MSDKLPMIARRQLVTTPRPDPAKISELLARARAIEAVKPPPALTKNQPPVATYAPPKALAARAPEQVRLQITCGATGRHFVGLAERRGDTVRLVGNEPMPAGHDELAGLLSGAYRVEAATGWVCPFCRVPPDDLWNCYCAEFSGAMHCCGGRSQSRYCFCGKYEPRHLEHVEKLRARGASVGGASAVGRLLIGRE